MQDELLKSGTVLSLDREHLLLGWGKRTWSKEPKQGPQPDFYFPDFFFKIGFPWFTHEHHAVMRHEELQEFQNHAPTALHWEPTAKETFAKSFYDLQEKLQTGKLQKGVPYIFERTTHKMSPSLLSSTLKYVLNYTREHPVHLYGMWNDGEGLLGATPEILFDYYTTVKTIACAGTFSLDRKNIDEKLLNEHELVVRGIQESLCPFGRLHTGHLECREFGSLGHLITPIELYPSHTLDYITLVKALHPTPALGAYPKDAGMQWLEKYQTKLARGRFGAPTGFWYQGKGRCFVAIRNVQWNERGMQIGAGCGVVAGSRLEEEWNELQLKLNAIKGILGW